MKEDTTYYEPFLRLSFLNRIHFIFFINIDSNYDFKIRFLGFQILNLIEFYFGFLNLEMYIEMIRL